MKIRGGVWLHRLGPLAALFVVYGLFVFLAPSEFTNSYTTETIVRQTVIVGIAALGMTLVIISGGIDLSVGSVVALVTVVIAVLLAAEVPPLLAGLGGIAAGLLAGLFNGAVITGFRLVPFIVTLGSMLILRGVAEGLAHESKVDAPSTWLSHLLAALGPEQKWMLVPVGVWILVMLAFGVMFLLHFMKLGRHIFAVGSNEETSRLAGVRVRKVKIIVYTIAGTLTGIAGLMQFSRLTVGDPTVSIGLELDVIAAVVIGGGRLEGGEGSVLGTIVGALIMTVIRVGCSQMGIDNWVQKIVTGGIIIVAVSLDRYRYRLG